MAGSENLETEKIAGPVPVLFPVGSQVSASSTVTPTLFPSFASGSSVFPIVAAPAGGENMKTKRIAGLGPALFPVSSQVPASSSVIPSLFPSVASASSGFPIVENAGAQQASSLDWLSNPTFSEVLLVPPPTSTSRPSDAAPGVEILAGNGGRISKDEACLAWASSSSERLGSADDEDRERDSSEPRRRRKKLNRKRRTEVDGIRNEKRGKKEPEHAPDPRRIGVLDSVASEKRSITRARVEVNARAQKEYYFDTRGDRESLAFGSLYRMDVAKYRRNDVRGLSERPKTLGQTVVQDEVVKSGGRYWSMKLASLERKRKLKILRLGSNKSDMNGNDHKSPHLAQFVPLEIDWLAAGGEGDLPQESREEGETWLEYVTLKTKELNQLARERPHDESVWIRFANFQDELIHTTNNRAAIQNLVAKKVAILEKAMNSHKGSEALLIQYLETCKRNDDASTLLSKWERAVHSHSGSLRMWQEFLHFRRAQFSTFSVSSLRTLYSNALNALGAARNQLGFQGMRDENFDEDFVEAEEALVSIFVDLCRFNWQAGHHELAVGLFQAEIEYSLFGPRMQLSESSKLKRFEDFWHSDARRFGEDGALGWVTYLKEEEDKKPRLIDAQLEEERVGGWTGWSAPVTDGIELNGTNQFLEDEVWGMEEDVDMDNDVLKEDENDEALLQKLGLSLNSSKDVEVNDSKIWKRWSEKEVQRDYDQWFPLHSQLGDEDDQLERMVLFDDVKESLFTLRSQQAQLSLIYQFVDFCNGPLSQWCCSNRESYISKLDSLVGLKGTMVADMNGPKWHEGMKENTLGKLMGSVSWYQESKGRAKFLQNCLSLVKPVFPHDRYLFDTMLNAEDFAKQDTGSSRANMVASRALAKKLLKIHRKDLLMWAAYACIEAAAGNIGTARTVFDTTLASLGDPTMEGDHDGSILYLAYAELELGQVSGQSDVSVEQRALYILYHLGSGSVYVPQPGSDGLSATMLLKGQRGFREHLQRVRISDRKNLTERGAALIACAALFEQLMNGWEGASAVFEEGLAMNLPEKRQQSLQCELLFLRYIQMLEKFKNGFKPARLQSIILQGLAQYPCNTELIGAFIQSASQCARSYDLRRFFDDASPRYSSPAIWLFALSWEMWRPRPSPRIHRLFERALESKETQHSVLLWRCYFAYEVRVALNPDAARRVYFRAIHACPWSKALWVDGFLKLSSILSSKELSEFVDVMRDKELRLRTDVYEILLEDGG